MLFSRVLFRLMMWFFFGRLFVSGREKLPQQGPYLIVTNHMSVADSVMVLLALPAMPIRFLISKKWRTLPFLGWLAQQLGGIYLDRTTLDREALEQTLEALQKGEIVGLAPEGTRSPIQQLIRPTHGAAYLAHRCAVPIVPVSLINTEKLFGNWARLRPTRIEAHIGDPFYLPKLERKVRSAELAAYTDYIMLNIARHLPPRYDGYYALTNHRGLEALRQGGDVWQACLTQHHLAP